MRLLISADTVGGVWEYAATLTTELERRRHAVLLAVLGDPDPSQLELLPEGIAVEARRLRLEWLEDPSADLVTGAEWLSSLARSWRADVVHLNQMAYTGLSSFSAPAVVAVHSDVGSWFREVTGAPPPATWAPYFRWITRGLRRAEMVVAPSRYQADLIAPVLGRPADRVIYNAVPFPSPPTGPKEKFVLSAGRGWDPAKGVDILDRALGALGVHAPPARLAGATRGPRGERAEVESLEVIGRLSRPELYRLMDRAAVYVAPCRYEPFGLAPVEAALRGSALVLSDIGSFRELWGDDALFFESGDAGALADALRQIFEDDHLRVSLATRAQRRAREQFGVKEFADAYEALYGGLHHPGSPPHVPSQQTIPHRTR